MMKVGSLGELLRRAVSWGRRCLLHVELLVFEVRGDDLGEAKRELGLIEQRKTSCQMRSKTLETSMKTAAEARF